ncbi:hypothetical protein C4K38_4649 [Pseudomonas chlororaphis subsp. piscium]|nr:hypothetical protein C4K38_4649 [Pseudomonas chlororaphis subsp. piscium]
MRPLAAATDGRLMQERLPGQIGPTMEPLRNAVTRSGTAA